jgi:hypothetical protein
MYIIIQTMSGKSKQVAIALYIIYPSHFRTINIHCSYKDFLKPEGQELVA